jgi:hypothetical protein
MTPRRNDSKGFILLSAIAAISVSPDPCVERTTGSGTASLEGSGGGG